MNLVTYLDFGPSFARAAIPGLQAWAAFVRSQDGSGEATLLCEINRAERFALVETWADPAQLDARLASGPRLEPAVAAGLAASPDERIGEPFSIEASRPTAPGSLHVLVHVDVTPFNLAAVGDWLKAEAEAARLAPGSQRYDIWRQLDRPNHFTVVQVWADQAAYARRVESSAARTFRDNLLTVKGALYDERRYQTLDWAA